MTAPVSRKNERTCVGCKHQFNAWSDPTRTHCYQCQPIPPALAKIVVRAVHRGAIRL